MQNSVNLLVFVTVLCFRNWEVSKLSVYTFCTRKRKTPVHHTEKSLYIELIIIV
jgi:hypothetical protein